MGKYNCVPKYNLGTRIANDMIDVIHLKDGLHRLTTSIAAYNDFIA